jgi:outer membrane protein OmpA-like peptidoglycan-associated protein
MRGWFFECVLSACLLWANSVRAQDLSIGYAPALESGDSPMLSITPERGLSRLHVELEVGGQVDVHEYGAVAAGQEVVISWERDTSVTEATAAIRAVFSDGFVSEYSVPMSYSYGSALDVDMSSVQIDLELGHISFEVTDAVRHAELISYGAHRAVLDRQLVPINAGPGRIEIPWEGNPKKVVLLEIIVHNESGMAAFDYSPWYLEIPHQDVLFETNQSDIPEEEEWKLQATLEELSEVQEMYGDMIDIKLYIGGCTDTVGVGSSNRDLSARRARTIARWLRAHGYASPILTYGFGESWLAVPTADGVDEPANRRAVYMVGTRPPPSITGVPRVGWKPL